MEYALIAPVNDLDLCRYQYYHMILAWACKDEGYLNFYKNIHKLRSSNHSILDNGANEGKLLEGEEYTDLANKLQVDEIIAPDEYKNWSNTIEKTEKFLRDDYKQLAPNVSVMAVAQGASPVSFIACWENFVKDPRIHVIGLGYRNVYDCVHDDMVGLSNADWGKLLFNNDYSEYEVNKLRASLSDFDFYMTFSRIFFLSRINLLQLTKPIHLLGLWNPIELKFMKTALSKEEKRHIRSCDSAAPTQAAQSYTMFNHDYGLSTKPQAMLKMFDTLGKGQREIAEKNFDILKAWSSWTNPGWVE